MASRKLPGLGLNGFWQLGEQWKTGGDENWLKLSVLAQLVVESATVDLPASPQNGLVYIVPPSASSNAGKVAVRDEGAWVYMDAPEGANAFVKDTGQVIRFVGGSWVTGRTSLGLGSAATAQLTEESLDTTEGRVLKVGDFGIGTLRGLALSDYSDFNEITIPGKYSSNSNSQVTSMLNKPLDAAGGLEVFPTGVGNGVGQRYTSYTGLVMSRTRSGATTWTIWQRVLTAGIMLQSTGQDTTLPMSQKATTDALTLKLDGDSDLLDSVIIETGSNSIGSWVKYADGRMTTIQKTTVTPPPVGSWSGDGNNPSQVIHALIPTPIYLPIEFHVDSDTVFHVDTRDNVISTRSARVAYYAASADKIDEVYLASTARQASGGSLMTISIKAEGYWK